MHFLIHIPIESILRAENFKKTKCIYMLLLKEETSTVRPNVISRLSKSSETVGIRTQEFSVTNLYNSFKKKYTEEAGLNLLHLQNKNVSGLGRK